MRSAWRWVRWVAPIAALAGCALCVFWIAYAADGGHLAEPVSALRRFWSFDAPAIADAIGSLAGIVAAILGIVITVVSIIVQLSANRFTGVTRLFLSDRITHAVMAYYIVTCIFGVWLGPALQEEFVPRLPLLVMLVLTSIGIALMAPYFGYVFWFLEPIHIVERIRSRALQAANRGSCQSGTERLHDSQAVVLGAMEELTDICSHSISAKDKIIAGGAVDAIKDLVISYLESKPYAHPQWFRVGSGIRGNPDFVAMAAESLAELERTKTWVEWKALRQYLGIYNDSLTSMRDINYLIAIDTRYIGEAGLRAGDRELVELVVRYVNSFLRTTINAKDVRTAYNVLNQYRLLVETMLRSGWAHVALQCVQHMKYYGHLSFERNLTFVTETVAYDVATLCQLAHTLAEVDSRAAHADRESVASIERALLDEFLELDQPLVDRRQEKGLLGVRKAQVKLACYYLDCAAPHLAALIARDLSQEPPARLRLIWQQLSEVEGEAFWEITDRGRNFEYMPASQRARLAAFFAQLGIDSTQAARAATQRLGSA